ncbi:MAG TPA: GNAT family N-acetyltransferase [Kofleriaceae bacterium]|nr:GNAT family N-acetyltransferase [Kofleriaceae bacterium]
MRWRDLAHCAAPFVDPDFFAVMQPLAGHEAIVVEAHADGALVGALPLVRDGDVLRAMMTDHSPAYDYTGTPEGLKLIWRALRKDHSWNELVLDKVSAFSLLAARLPVFAEADYYPVVIAEDTRHPFLPLGGVTAAMNPKFRANLQRCMRKAGRVELERLTQPSRTDLDDAYAIEARAWKGAAGTAIANDAKVDHAYRAIARLYGRRGQHSLYFLKIEGVRMATLFALEDAHALYALKIGHDPAYSNLSPGHLLVWQVAQDAERRGLHKLDFIGREDGWKRKWTEHVHPLMRITIYRRSLVGLTRYAKRELVRPRLPEPMRTTPRSPLPRRCQHDDKLGIHTPLQLARARILRGFGIKARLRHPLRSPPPVGLGRPSQFPVGSWVRVRDAAALDATLNAKRKLRGLELVDAQRKTAGGVFQVERHVRRLRDDKGRYRAVHGTVLLAGVDCSGGTAEPTGCGRHCPLMYRDEWLEAAPPLHLATPPARTTRHAHVRDLAEIYAGLDAFGRRDGITFMPEMSQYAGQRFAIANELDEVFECDHWTETAQPVFILDGLHCSGAVLGSRGPCDRACALLWHRDWLMIEPGHPEL